MKRLLSVALLALGAILVLQQPAHAWINSRFSVGLNWSWQSANNNFLWGAFQNGPSHGSFIGGDCGYGGFGYPGGFLIGGGYPSYGAVPYPAVPAAPADPKTPAGKDATGKDTTGLYYTIPAWQGGNIYQSASYPGTTPAYTPSYYPSYGTGYYYYPGYATYPSYWYGW